MLFVGRSIPRSAAVTGGTFNQTVVHAHVAEAEIVDQCRREQMRLVDAEKARGHRDVEGKIQVRGADAAGQCSAERSLQTARAEGSSDSALEKKKRAAILSLPP